MLPREQQFVNRFFGESAGIEWRCNAQKGIERCGSSTRAFWRVSATLPERADVGHDGGCYVATGIEVADATFSQNQRR